MSDKPQGGGGRPARDTPAQRTSAGSDRSKAASAPPARVSGVRTEHQLRVQLRDALERNTTFERALREAAAFAYGGRDLTDLRRLKASLSAAGFSDPNVRRSSQPDNDGDPDPPKPSTTAG